MATDSGSDKSGRQQCITLVAAWSALRTSASTLPPSPRMSEQGVTRDLSGEWTQMREEFRARHRERAGPRFDWIQRIIKDEDALGLLDFIEAGRRSAKAQTLPHKATCSWCNKRIVEELTPQLRNDGFRAAQACQVCLHWHCMTHCVVVDFDLCKQRLVCCERCQRLVETEFWHRTNPPEGLSPVQLALFTLREQLLGALTRLSSSLPQLEGALRTLDKLERQDGQTSMVATMSEVAHTSHQTVRRAELEITAIMRKLADLPTPAPPVKVTRASDPLLKEAILKLARVEMDLLKPRVRAAELKREAQVLGLSGSSAGPSAARARSHSPTPTFLSLSLREEPREEAPQEETT